MKNRSRILSVTSGFLILLFLIGTSGAVIVEHSCYSCGLSDLHTEFFTSESQNHSCSCDSVTTSPPDNNEKTIEPVCCIFSFDKLSLTEYNYTPQINLSVVSTPAFSHTNLSLNEQPEKPDSSLLIHNKHGGRDILRSVCQLII